MYFSIAFCIAVLASGFQSSLPATAVCHCIILFALVLALLACRLHHWRQPLSVACGVLLGFAYASLVADQRMQQQLPEAFEQQDLDLLVRVASLPVEHDRYQQYRVDVLDVSAPAKQQLQLQHLLLNDYQSSRIQPCEQWRMTVRLKRPHGLGNPAGFDYEAYLLELGVQGKGYVRQAQKLAGAEGFCLHRIRQAWSDFVREKVPADSAAWIVALSTGDKSLLNDEQTTLLLETGTTHLFVISGSHIALCAFAVYAGLMLLRRLGLGRIWAGDWRPPVAMAALLVAAIYTAIAGYGVPSQRSLIMLTVFLGTQIAGLQTSLWLRYWLSMLAVLLVNPLAALNVGFVLSFAAVFVLILLAEAQSKLTVPQARLQRFGYVLKELFWAQLVIFIGLLPFTACYFGQVSLLAPLANFIAVPAMSLVLLPTILLALLLWLLAGTDYGLLDMAARQLDMLFWLIETLNRYGQEAFPTFPLLALNNTMVMVLALGCLLMLLPRVFRVWPLGGLLVMAVLLADARPVIPYGALQLDIIDVDQGLAMVIHTANHQMLVDTGSAWPGGSMAGRAVKPVLLQQGVRQLDKVLLSHLDNDHAGGIHELLATFAVGEVLSSEAVAGVDSRVCKAGESWHWDGVDFLFLHPDDAARYAKRNDKSCILLIGVAGRYILLPGDIEARVEAALVPRLPVIDVLVAPHHGSKTSSTAALAEKTANGLVVFSSAYLSQFRHPHPDIVQRYHAVRARTFITGLAGLVSIGVSAEGHIDASAWRQEKGRYWHKVRRTGNHAL